MLDKSEKSISPMAVRNVEFQPQPSVPTKRIQHASRNVKQDQQEHKMDRVVNMKDILNHRVSVYLAQDVDYVIQLRRR